MCNLPNHSLLPLTALAMYLGIAPANPGTTYSLNTRSQFEDGCHAPCLCPIHHHGPVNSSNPSKEHAAAWARWSKIAPGGHLPAWRSVPP